MRHTATATPASAQPTNQTPVMKLTLSAPEIAEALGVSRGHIDKLMDAGVIPRLPLGRRNVMAAWRLTSFLATGDWDHPDFRPPAAAPPAA